MKLKLFISLLLFVLFGTEACKKNLDETPYSFMNQKVVFSNEDGLKEATLGVYESWINSSPFIFPYFRFILAESGQKYVTAGQINDSYTSPYYKFAETPTDLSSFNQWPTLYRTIVRANTVIAHANQAVSDSNVANVYKAEARFNRAYAYFNLVRNFGGVPLIKEEITSLAQKDQIYGERASIQDVYNFIIEDLQFAENNLPPFWTGADLGRISAGAAKGLLGKVYLTGAGLPLQNSQYYQLAVNKLNEIVGPGEATYHFTLLPNYSDVFSINNKRNNEIVFSYSYFWSTGHPNASIFPFFLSPLGLLDSDVQPCMGFTPDFYNLFEAGDNRRDFTLISRYIFKGQAPISTAGIGDSIIYDFSSHHYINKNRGGIIVGNANIYSGLSLGKYSRESRPAGAVPWGYSTDLIELRFSDVLLCLAEALNETGQTANSVTLLNRVRARANASLYSVGSQEVVRDQIRKERRLELTGEFTTVYDIRRWGTLKEEIAAMNPAQIVDNSLNAYSSKLELYPIPQSEMDANPNLKQNPGW